MILPTPRGLAPRTAFVAARLLVPAVFLVHATTADAQQFQHQVGLLPGVVWSEGVEAADVDRDGDMDLFFADGDGFSSAGTKRQNTLLINRIVETSTLSFQDESVARLGVHVSNAKGVFTGDVDGDGFVDAMFANAFNTDLPFLYMNRGAVQPGFFDEEGAARGFTEALSSASGQFGDLDDDGDLDVVLCDSGALFLGGSGGKQRLYLNDGSGSFSEVTGPAWNPPTKSSQMDIQFVDVDGDFDLDVLGTNRASNGGRPHTLMINDGAGSFSDASTSFPATSSSVYEAEVGDLDGDDDLDLFFVSLTGFDEGAMRNDTPISGAPAFVPQSALSATFDDNEVVLVDYD